MARVTFLLLLVLHSCFSTDTDRPNAGPAKDASGQDTAGNVFAKPNILDTARGESVGREGMWVTPIPGGPAGGFSTRLPHVLGMGGVAVDDLSSGTLPLVGVTIPGTTTQTSSLSDASFGQQSNSSSVIPIIPVVPVAVDVDMVNISTTTPTTTTTRTTTTTTPTTTTTTPTTTTTSTTTTTQSTTSTQTAVAAAVVPVVLVSNTTGPSATPVILAGQPRAKRQAEATTVVPAVAVVPVNTNVDQPAAIVPVVPVALIATTIASVEAGTDSPSTTLVTESTTEDVSNMTLGPNVIPVIVPAGQSTLAPEQMPTLLSVLTPNTTGNPNAFGPAAGAAAAGAGAAAMGQSGTVDKSTNPNVAPANPASAADPNLAKDAPAVIMTNRRFNLRIMSIILESNAADNTAVGNGNVQVFVRFSLSSLDPWAAAQRNLSGSGIAATEAPVKQADTTSGFQQIYSGNYNFNNRNGTAAEKDLYQDLCGRIPDKSLLEVRIKSPNSAEEQSFSCLVDVSFQAAARPTESYWSPERQCTSTESGQAGQQMSSYKARIIYKIRQYNIDWNNCSESPKI